MRKNPNIIFNKHNIEEVLSSEAFCTFTKCKKILIIAYFKPVVYVRACMCACVCACVCG